MANLKDSLAKGITTINVKTNNFMEQSKAKTYITTLEREINDLKRNLGDLYYNKWIKNESMSSEADELVNSILSKYEEIEARKKHIQKLIEEEQQILGTASSGQETDIIFCGQCGAKNAGCYKYCCKCGAPLK